MNHAIELSRVCHSFGRKHVLNEVSLSVPQGTVFALLGENGAGKSTLIRGLLGYHRFQSGTVNVLGIDPTKKPLEVRRAVGYVADAPAMYEWMRISEVGEFAACFYPKGFLSSFVRIATEFELPFDTRVRDLSKGMRAKLALSLAMAFDPSLLVLDEPTSGLDPQVRRQFLESMVDRAAAGQTVFLSSHQVHEVERVADWVAILHQGSLQVVAPLEDLKSSVAQIGFSVHDPYVALPNVIANSNVLLKNETGRRRTLTIQAWNRPHEEELRADPNVFDVQIVRPNLEELYLAYTHQKNESQVTIGKVEQHGVGSSAEVA